MKYQSLIFTVSWAIAISMIGATAWADETTDGCCIVPNNGSGTVTLPAPCPYIGHPDFDAAVDEKYATIKPNVTAELHDYTGASEVTGGTLGGTIVHFGSTLTLHLVADDGKVSYFLDVPVDIIIHTAPRTPGNAVQDFDTALIHFSGHVTDATLGDLTIAAGADASLPSPGHMTLTQQSDGTFAVEALQNVAFHADFVGATGTAFEGYEEHVDGVAEFRQGGDCEPEGEGEGEGEDNDDGDGQPPCDYRTLFNAEWPLLATDLGLNAHIAESPGNHIPERWAIAMVTMVLCHTDHPFNEVTTTGYLANIAALESEAGPVATRVAPYKHILAALLMVNESRQDHFKELLGLLNDYAIVRTPEKALSNEPFSDLGDLDSDGIANVQEYQRISFAGGTMSAFAAVAADASVLNADPVPAAGTAAVVLLAGILVASGTLLRVSRKRH